ncbi:MAG: 3-dehydroquinate synthase, partial [Gammaproteobacteria bacterium]|nr:3-dehydroquinate synthase [Gammaproteobacteria bacterium]
MGSTATSSSRAEETTVDVALSTRGYPIVIGEDLLGSAAARLKALLPNARFAVVSDANV